MKHFENFSDVDGLRKCMKKPIPVQAKQINEKFIVESLEGPLNGKPGDYLVKGVDGELYICDKNIFEKTYDFL